ncbi:hypothetical protein BGZ73_000711 [Actinomortierella ambigua]|nr:hypothetical protein BGZ73_000711 [Actinomortierella ambigua]
MATLEHQLAREGNQDVHEPNDEQAQICLRRYLPWIMEKNDEEHVSFASFVEKFKLTDQQNAQMTFEALISSSQLKAWRQQSLKKAYDTFKKHNMRGFWSHRMLEIERRETKTYFDMTATKTARIVQNASLNETSKAAALSDDNHDQGDQKCLAQSKRKMKQGTSSKSVNKRAKACDETSTNKLLDDDLTTIGNPCESTVDSGDGSEIPRAVTEPRPQFDLQSARRVNLVLDGFDVGAAFRLLQEEAAPFINNEDHKISIKKLHLMLTANSIWDTSERLPGMSVETHRRILSQIKPALIRLPAEKIRLILDLSHELSTTDRVRSRALETEEDEDLLHLFKDLSKNLPQSGEGMHALKPDCTIMKEQFDLGFAEIKAPKDERCMRLYIEDKWALTSMAKDSIDLHLRERRAITSIFCLQVFGYQLAAYELRFQSGIYMWTEIGIGYLPRDKNDTRCLISCMELLNTVKSLVEAIPVRQYISTPPQRDPDHLLPEELRPQPTNISPSFRQFFGRNVKSSTNARKSNAATRSN